MNEGLPSISRGLDDFSKLRVVSDESSEESLGRDGRIGGGSVGIDSWGTEGSASVITFLGRVMGTGGGGMEGSGILTSTPSALRLAGSCRGLDMGTGGGLLPIAPSSFDSELLTSVSSLTAAGKTTLLGLGTGLGTGRRGTGTGAPRAELCISSSLTSLSMNSKLPSLTFLLMESSDSIRANFPDCKSPELWTVRIVDPDEGWDWKRVAGVLRSIPRSWRSFKASSSEEACAL